MKKLMTEGVVMFSSIALAAVSAVAETVYNWNGPTDGTTPATAASWEEPGNWDRESVPNAASDAAVLKAADADYFVKVESARTLNRVRGSEQDVTKNYIVGEEPLTITYGEQGDLTGCGYFFVPVVFGAAGGVWTRNGWFCDDVTADAGPLYTFFGHTYIRYDRYAKSSDPVRSASIGSVMNYNGSNHFYAPRGCPSDQTASFDVTEGSPYIRNRSPYDVLNFVAAGTLVEGEGIDEGSYVKRIFNSEWVELSKPAIGTAGETTLTFKAFTSDLTVRIGTLSSNGTADPLTLFANKWTDTDSFDLEIDNLVFKGAGEPFVVGVDSGCKPGRTVIRNVKTLDGNPVTLHNCRIRFAEADSGAEPGFPDNVVSCDSVAYLEVTNGLRAAIGRFFEVTGGVVKEGTGELVAGLGDGSTGCGGQFVVSEGTLRFTAPDGAVAPTIGRIDLLSGATLAVPACGLVVRTLVVEAGATLAGPGVITTDSSVNLTGVNLAGGGVVTRSASTYQRAPDEVFPATLVSQPAFWVDASQTNSMDLVTDGETGRVFVRRWNDVRGEGYNFAANPDPADTSKMPWVLFDKDGSDAVTDDVRTVDPSRSACAVHFQYDGVRPSAANWSQGFRTLTWDQPVTGIRAVFQVLDAGYLGGGFYLGATPRLTYHLDDFLRACDSPYEASQPIFYPNDSTKSAREGVFRIDGKVYDGGAQAYPYGGYPVTGVPDRIVPTVTSLQTVISVYNDYPQADSFDVNVSGGQFHGKKRLCELIVFTNEVSETDVRAITGYLMKKWQNCRVDFTPGMKDGSTLGTVDVSGSAQVGAAEGTTMTLDDVTGAGTLRKSGAGTLIVRDFVHPQLSLAVDAGTMEVASVDPQPLPGAFLHLDAAKGVTAKESGTGGVTAWADVRGEGYPVARAISEDSPTQAHIEANAFNGLPVVDFGEANYYSGRANEGPGLRLSQKSNNLHTLITVWGSQNGGGVLLGTGDEHYLAGYGTLRGPNFLGQQKDSAIFLPDSRPGTANAAFGNVCTLNGTAVNPTTTGLSGGYDTFVYRGVEPFGLAAISSADSDIYQGGQKIGEYIVYPWGLSSGELATVKAYIDKKWYGVSGVPDNRAAVVSNVSVAAGATLRLVGGAPMSVASVSVGCGGTLEGSLAAAAPAVVEVVVNDDGTISPLTVSGSVDFSQGGVVRIVGNLRALQGGTYEILSAAELTGGTWTIDPGLASVTRKTFAASVRGNRLCLQVFLPGLSVIIR